MSLIELIIWDGDRGVLTIARSDNYRGVFMQKAIRLPMKRCILDPVMIAIHDKMV